MNVVKNINKLQIPTWSWLKINDTSLAVDDKIIRGYTQDPVSISDDRIQMNQNGNLIKLNPKQPVITKELKEYVISVCNYRLDLSIPAGVVVREPILLDFRMDEEDPFLADHISIHAEKGSKATVVMIYRSDEKASFHGGFTNVMVEEQADIKLVQIQMLSGHHLNAAATEVVVEEGGNADIILIELGGGKTTKSCNVELRGDHSSSELQGIYVGNRDKTLDLNYRMEYCGKNTLGNITVKGVLLDNAKKTMKSTLDFQPGSRNAKGRESESVIALSPKVINVSAPLLLCGEDNVEGQHATNIGRPDSDKLFYLMSRGLTERQAKALMVEASMASILDMIDSSELRKEISARIGGAIQNA